MSPDDRPTLSTGPARVNERAILLRLWSNQVEALDWIATNGTADQFRGAFSALMRLKWVIEETILYTDEAAFHPGETVRRTIGDHIYEDWRQLERRYLSLGSNPRRRDPHADAAHMLFNAVQKEAQ